MTTQTENVTQQSSAYKNEDEQADMFSAGVSFSSLGVSPESVESLGARDIRTPTKAQQAVIPLLLDGLAMQMQYATQIASFDEMEAAKDYHEIDQIESETDEHAPAMERPQPQPEDVNDVIMYGAETGSGKTLAYLLPYVEAFRDKRIELKAIVLVPSRELCSQVGQFLTQYFPDPPPHLVLAGGRPPDISDAKNVKVIIATPRALLTYFRFSQKPDASDKMIIVDEADMLLSGAFLKDIEQILNQPGMKPFATRKNGELRRVNKNRLVFVGATYPHWTGERVKSIVTWMKRRYPDMKVVQTGGLHRRSGRLRSEWSYTRDDTEKLNSLIDALENATEHDKVMIFASKASRCGTLKEAVLQRIGMVALTEKFGGIVELHKGVHWEEREENLKKFRKGEARLLLCTDLGSRGLDLGDVTGIIEYDFATNVVAYLHRIGRTARAGRDGWTSHFYDEVSRPLAETIRKKDHDGEVVKGVFSRNRSFRRKWKQQMEVNAGDIVIDGIDEEEEARLDG